MSQHARRPTEGTRAGAAPAVPRRMRCDSRQLLLEIAAGALMLLAVAAYLASWWSELPGWERVMVVAGVAAGAVWLGGAAFAWLASWVAIDPAERRVVIHRRGLAASSHDDLPFEAVDAVAIERKTWISNHRASYRIVVRPRRASAIPASAWQGYNSALVDGARTLSQAIGCRLVEPD